MRVLIAPDDFAGTLTAVQAADAIAAGWRRGAPRDDVRCLPLSDGGPGFVSVLAAAARDGDTAHVIRSTVVSGPLGEDVPASVVVIDGTAYVESAQACGLALIPEAQRDPLITSTRGVGQLLRQASGSGVARIVVGLGGSGTCDGGAGMLSALGARAWNASGDPVALDAGGGSLSGVASIDVSEAAERLRGIEVVAATDVDAPLLGEHGAARGYAPQKGAPRDAVDALEDALSRFANASGAAALAGEPGAGAAGGLGFALMLLGAARASGAEIVRDLVHLDAAVAWSDLVVTGEGRFDWQSLRGKVVSAVAGSASAEGCPVIVIAGQVAAGRREAAAHGIVESYAVSDGLPVGDPAQALAERAESVARQWRRTVPEAP